MTTLPVVMLVGLGTCLLAVSPVAMAAQPEPFRDGDAAQGKVLVDRDCVACHARQLDGDAARMYLRPDHRVKTPAQLLAQVRYCNTQLGTSYFPDEEANVAAHLNASYYHFPP